jgi:mannose-6-phosphate isomerase-like protein (cupin superfamily)
MPILNSSPSNPRRIDPFIEIRGLFSDPSARFDAVIAELDGPHGYFLNRRSEKAYFILEGSGEVLIEGQTTSVKPNDMVFIPTNTRHGIKGKLRFLVISSPPFNPKDEEALGGVS